MSGDRRGPLRWRSQWSATRVPMIQPVDRVRWPDGETPLSISIRRFTALAAVLFAVALGYGTVLPVLPAMLDHLMPGAPRDVVSRHTGALTTAYMIAIIAFAPLWGRASDRFGRRPLVLLGTAGYALSLAAFAWAMSMAQAYVLRFAAGMFAAAVLPVASAAAGEIEDTERRASWLAGLGTASLLGYLAGPAITSVVYALTKDPGRAASLAERIGLPIYTAAGIAVVGLMIAHRVLVEKPRPNTSTTQTASGTRDGDFVREVVLSVAAMAGLGAFEVGLTVLVAQTVGASSGLLALLFVECSAVMLVVQGLVAWKRGVASRLSRALIPVGFAAMGAGFVVLATTRDTLPMYVAVALIGSGAGTLLPLLTFLTSMYDRARLGATLGAQSAAASFGQAAGSAAGGWLFAVMDARSFWLYAAVMIMGAVKAARSRIGP